jgi:hypothetical protein
MSNYAYYAALIFGICLGWIGTSVLMCWFFPRTEDDTTDLHADEYTGTSAPREE